MDQLVPETYWDIFPTTRRQPCPLKLQDLPARAAISTSKYHKSLVLRINGRDPMDLVVPFIIPVSPMPTPAKRIVYGGYEYFGMWCFQRQH